MKYFLTWKDYDGYRLEEFETEEKLLARITELHNSPTYRPIPGTNEFDYGFSIEAVIYGTKREIVPVQVATQFVLG